MNVLPSPSLDSRVIYPPKCLLICGNAFARIGHGDLDPTFILRIIVFNQDVSLRREFCGVVYEVGNHLG